MSDRLLSGTVKFFDSREEKRFGFIKAEDGKEYFFHLHQGSAPWVKLWRFDNYPMATPKPGDRVVFDLVPGKKGIRAGAWYFADDYEKAVAQFERNRNFRVIDPNDGGKIVWEGKDEEEFKKKILECIALEAKSLARAGMRFERMDPVLGLWDEWLALETFLEKADRYRVVSLTRYQSKIHPIRAVVWSGSNKAEVAKKFPRGKGMDELASETYPDFTITFVFQERVVSGQWEERMDWRSFSHSEFTSRQMQHMFRR